MRPVSSCLIISTFAVGIALASAVPASASGRAGLSGGGHGAVAFGHGGGGRGFSHHRGLRWPGHRGSLVGWHDGRGRFGHGFGRGFRDRGDRLGYGSGFGLGYGFGDDGWGGSCCADTGSYPWSGPVGLGYGPGFAPVAIGIREPPVKAPALYVVESGSRSLRRRHVRFWRGADLPQAPAAKVAVLTGAPSGDSGPRIIQVAPHRTR